MTKRLFLEDFDGWKVKQLKGHISSSWDVPKEVVNDYQILIAYESEGSWGCDSSGYFLLKEKKTGKLYEVHGSHCSCYGFEGQFEPEEVTEEYLKSKNGYLFYRGGYDSDQWKESSIKRFLEQSVFKEGQT